MTQVGLAILVTALTGPSIAHRLLVPALGLVVGVRVWWPAPASGPVPTGVPPTPTPNRPPGTSPAPPKPRAAQDPRRCNPSAASGADETAVGYIYADLETAPARTGR
jgi:hypothetical protein